MPAERLELLVEEPSAEAALRVLLPKMSPGLDFDIHVHLSKEDLLKKLPSRLRGYADWLPENWKVLVVVDRDNEDCRRLKQRLTLAAREAGFTGQRGRYAASRVVGRIAIEELEAWFFGDWAAVVAAYPGVDPNVPDKAGFREPDGIRGGTWEALERLLQRAGYHMTGLRKIEAARAIAEKMIPARNRSASFRALFDAIRVA